MESYLFLYINGDNVWRRLTVSYCRDEPLAGSLELQLINSTDHRDKTERIFSEIRGIVDTMEFISELKMDRLALETKGTQLYINNWGHDLGFLISFPQVTSGLMSRFNCRLIPESSVSFVSLVNNHPVVGVDAALGRDMPSCDYESLGVFKVSLEDVMYIKVDICTPGGVAKFLDDTERDAQRHILKALLTNKQGTHVKARLLSLRPLRPL